MTAGGRQRDNAPLALEEADPRGLPIALDQVARARKRWGLPAPRGESPLPLEVKTHSSGPTSCRSQPIQRPTLKPSEVLNLHRETIRRIVEANNTLNPRVFGSVMRGEDHQDSDLDFLVDTTDKTTLFDLGCIVDELTELLGVPVDVRTPLDLPEKWRDEVLSTAIPV